MSGISCVHCGEDCGKHPVIADNKHFCCEGCKMVFFILNEKKLGRYYEIQKMPGIKIEDDHIPRKEKYAFLDIPAIQEKLLDFNSDGVSKIRLFIPSIHCASCIWLLENLYTLNEGILQSSVNFPKKELSVTYKNGQISLRQLVELLSGIHYIPEISQKDTDKKNASKANKTLLIKIGIAGFSFMNSMIYHFPQYLPGNRNLDPGFKSFFGWLSFGLALPVLFYCAEDYFKTAFKSLKNKSISIDLPIALGLIAFFFQSVFEIVTGAGIGYIDSLTGLVFFMLIGKWYQGLTYQALSFERDYKTYFPVAVTVIEEDKQINKPIDQLKAGETILVRHYEIIPADSVITKGEANIDYSFVTGESMPVRKNTGDFLFAGGRQIGGAIYLRVKKDVQQSYLTQLWNQNKNKISETHYLKSTVNRVSQYFTVIVLIIALIACIYWMYNDPSKALFALTSVLIIACPCALALTVPFTFGSTMRQFGRSGFYLKNTEVIENIKKIDTVVFDKTGTITYSKSSNVLFDGDYLSADEKQFIKSAVFQSTHPMSKIISEKLENEIITEIDEFSEYKGMGIMARKNNNEIRIGSELFITGKQTKAEVKNTQVWIEINKKTRGRFIIENHYRLGLKELLASLGHNFELHLISGDNDSEMQNLKLLFPEGSKLNFNQTPSDKLNYIKELQKRGKKVMMVGDGLNDAGALHQSDTGIVIADDIYNFTPACDAILQSSKFQNLNKFIFFTRKSLRVVWISFVISFLYNTFGLFFAVQGNLSPIFAAILMPVSSVSVVAFASFSIVFLSKRANL